MPISFLVLLQIDVICLDQVKSDERVTPRYLKSSTLERGQLSPTWRGASGYKGDLFLENVMKQHLETFSFR